MRVRILGVGMGPQHVTPEVAEALRSCDYVVAAEKSGDDGLLAARRAIAELYGVEVVAVPDPERDRRVSTSSTSGGDYDKAVQDWHAARVDAYEQVLRGRGGTAAFLVWGDPSLYDSTIRVVEQLAAHLPIEYDVLPGISAPQLLAAEHRIVLHEVGQPLLVTTERRLSESLAAGADNIVVMLTSGFSAVGVEDWQVWWGANLGTSSARIVSGRAADVAATIRGMRAEAKAEAGWVMDLYLLRRVS